MKQFNSAYPNKDYLKHNVEQIVVNTNPETLNIFTQNTQTKRGGCLFLRKWWTFSAAAVKLFCNFFIIDTS
jgi:hypothetical protein